MRRQLSGRVPWLRAVSTGFAGSSARRRLLLRLRGSPHCEQQRDHRQHGRSRSRAEDQPPSALPRPARYSQLLAKLTIIFGPLLQVQEAPRGLGDLLDQLLHGLAALGDQGAELRESSSDRRLNGRGQALEVPKTEQAIVVRRLLGGRDLQPLGIGIDWFGGSRQRVFCGRCPGRRSAR